MALMDTAAELFDGVCEDDMTHVKDISTYNHNYYLLNGHLLYGVSDDDNFTQWYWVLNLKFIAIGGSLCDDGYGIIIDPSYT